MASSSLRHSDNPKAFFLPSLKNSGSRLVGFGACRTNFECQALYWADGVSLNMSQDDTESQ